ncbi:Outer membrane receptor proteins, mostly Fe transport [Robiginitalea myxolifaciens]|uniref:Outer membrane receptor proteins, mostly Fe transport n=1 Tax=Robiginitalea myxolifaciens TaxID=400055 RepID=A0A1I6HEV4_9FLAO|nr:TonB-dependent receptor [Robiginitalea myxolifaciens]SFR53022.1 Outer membrane receptor proteins, mostly Fe transport [Robiginitalea myxolifaciens]
MRLLILSFLLLVTSQAFAQEVSGVLKTTENTPVPFAAISMLQAADTSLVKATISGEEGSFRFQGIPAGNYMLDIQVLGFSQYRQELEVASGNLDLGTITLEEEAQNLDEVTVVGEKPMIQVEADKTVFNVQNTINATGTSAFELLRKAPGVIVDNNGGVIVEGKAGVQFFIDGRLSPLQGEDLINYLESLQATDIESVEIITQPSSRYDAAGNAGIINIVLIKDKSLGTNGTLTSGLTIGNFKRWNNSINFNTRGKKGNLYGTYSNRFGKSANFLNLLRTQAGTQFDARTRSTYDQNTNNVRLGYDRYLDDKHTVGAIFNGNFNNGYGINDSRTPIYPVGSPTLDSVLVAENRTSNLSYNISTNVNYRYKDTLGVSLNVDLDYGKYNSDRVAFQPNIYLDGTETQVISQRISRQLTPIDIDIFTALLDYEQNFLGGKLGAGFKISRVDTDNVFDFFNVEGGNEILDLDQSNRFTYLEDIYAGYFNYNIRWKKWNVQAGLRVERTVSDGQLFSTQDNADDRVQRDYTNYFPSGGLTYQASPKNQFALTYSKRIQRPNYASLNPFRFQIDELSSRVGNPFLQPQYTDNVKLSHTYNYRLTTSISYSYVSDFFAQVTVADGDTRNFLTVRNVADLETINFGVSYPKQLTPWWNLYVSLNAFRNSYTANSPEFLPVTQETLSGYVQNTLTLPGDLRMEISGWYSSPSVWGGTYQTRALGSLNLAFQKKFFADRLTARLAFNDILYTVPWRGTTQFGTLFIDGSGGSDSRQMAFALTYNFGRDEIKKARNRKTGLEEERGRIE